MTTTDDLRTIQEMTEELHALREEIAQATAMRPVVDAARRVLDAARQGAAATVVLPRTGEAEATLRLYNALIAAFEGPLNDLDATLQR